MALMVESLRVQQETQQAQIRRQQERLNLYEANLQEVADQVRAQGELLEAHARLYQLDRVRIMAPPAAEVDPPSPTLTEDAGGVPEPPVAQQAPDDHNFEHHEASASSQPLPLEADVVACTEARVDAPPSGEPGIKVDGTGLSPPSRAPSPTHSSSSSTGSSARTTATPAACGWIRCTSNPPMATLPHPLPHPPPAFLPYPPTMHSMTPPFCYYFNGMPHYAALPMPPPATNLEHATSSGRQRAALERATNLELVARLERKRARSDCG